MPGRGARLLGGGIPPPRQPQQLSVPGGEAPPPPGPPCRPLGVQLAPRGVKGPPTTQPPRQPPRLKLAGGVSPQSAGRRMSWQGHSPTHQRVSSASGGRGPAQPQPQARPRSHPPFQQHRAQDPRKSPQGYIVMYRMLRYTYRWVVPDKPVHVLRAIAGIEVAAETTRIAVEFEELEHRARTVRSAVEDTRRLEHAHLLQMSVQVLTPPKPRVGSDHLGRARQPRDARDLYPPLPPFGPPSPGPAQPAAQRVRAKPQRPRGRPPTRIGEDPPHSQEKKKKKDTPTTKTKARSARAQSLPLPFATSRLGKAKTSPLPAPQGTYTHVDPVPSPQGQGGEGAATSAPSPL
eukprot:TRINITY_DN19360_c0_g1_i1.p1 TRINITY_DN19360_c0_g1~~TRINITY_DN19360_c0_g1_i1.p1  ORF type:complete len:347 (+),score=52.02 TRINITY_DN19360_c0_g1_i1:88-1128(+)